MTEPTAAVASAVADTICRTVELGVTITGAAAEPQLTHLFAEVLAPDLHCPGCGTEGRLRDRVVRSLTDLPLAGLPTRLHLRVPRLHCERAGCAVKVFRAGIDQVAARRASCTHRVTRWILQRLVCDKMSISAVGKVLGVGWNTVNSLALSACRSLVYDGDHLDGVRVIGVDEHTWKHVQGQGDPSSVTVIVDLTPVLDGTGPARLLDMVPGRSQAAFAGWLKARDQAFRDRVKVVAMDGFTGYRTAAEAELPQAVTVMDPFHVVHLAADKLTVCRQRIQQLTCGHRGRKGDPLYGIRRLVLTRPALLTDKQQTRLDAGLAADEMHVAVDVTRQVYLQLIDAYQQPNRATGKKLMLTLLEKIRGGLPPGLGELAQLGRTLWRKRAQVLAYFDTDASNGPVEAINGRLEHLRGIALGFRNLEHYILRSLLHSGQLADRVNAL